MYPAEDSETAFLTERFTDWLGDRPAEEPWFAHLTYVRPHPPFFAPAPWHDLVDPADVPLPARLGSADEEAAIHLVIAGALMMGLFTAPESERDVRQLRATYLGMLAEVDHHIGQVMDRLDELGMTDDTVIVLTADHGEQLGDHWLIEKLGYHESSYHIPLIISGPTVDAGVQGTTVDEFTENIDLMPTILRTVGADVPKQCQGADLSPFLGGETPTGWRSAVFFEWDFRSVGSTDLEDMTGLTMAQCNLAVIRDRHGKYVSFGGMPPLFFDLDEDPHEFQNLADDPAHAVRVLDYAQRLMSWRQSTDDETLASTLVTPFGVLSR